MGGVLPRILPYISISSHRLDLTWLFGFGVFGVLAGLLGFGVLVPAVASHNSCHPIRHFPTISYVINFLLL